MVVGKQHESTRKSNTKGVIREGENLYLYVYRYREGYGINKSVVLSRVY